MAKASKKAKPLSKEPKLDPALMPLVQQFPKLRQKVESLTKEQLFPESVLQPAGLQRVWKALEDKRWSRESQSKVLNILLSDTGERHDLGAESVEQWIRYHGKDEWEAVVDCIQLVPPPEVTILGRLPRTGSQKIVFLASWKLQQKTVILKKLLSPSKIDREMRSHPLSADHPNIIKTYTAQNSRGEVLLIEEYLDEVLHDDWEPSGTEAVALLTHDIAAALKYVSGQGLVHGDVKPDNIGFHRARFVLLDFGICRPAGQFTPDASATGSLRTRAPELLLRSDAQSIKSDVWALGAVLSRVYCGLFPLVEPGEKVPRVSDPDRRSAFEETLRQRAGAEYDKRVLGILQRCPEHRIRNILTGMLARDPAERPNPAEIVDLVKSTLGYAIPESEIDAPWTSSPRREILLLDAQWSDRESVRRLPPHRLQMLRQYVERLKQKLNEAPVEDKHVADQLYRSLSVAEDR